MNTIDTTFALHSHHWTTRAVESLAVMSVAFETWNPALTANAIQFAMTGIAIKVQIVGTDDRNVSPSLTIMRDIVSDCMANNHFWRRFVFRKPLKS